MARRFAFKKGINVKRVVSKLAITLIVLYAGGYIVTEVGNVMINTSSPFNPGLSLIGWTVSNTVNGSSQQACSDGAAPSVAWGGCITSTSGTGILTVVGIIGVASIVLEFVQFRL